jgi:DNA-binding transcriptional regulator PaaX
MFIKTGSISSKLLYALEKASNGILYLEEFTYSGQMKALAGIPIKHKDQALVMAIRRLRMRKIIEYEKNADGKIYYQLTDIGRDFLNSKKRIEIEGRYTVVVWDIPETKRTVRNLLRRRLKEWGFRSWQKSVWVSRRDVASKLRTFISEVGIEKWVGVIESEDPVLGSLFVKH